MRVNKEEAENAVQRYLRAEGEEKEAAAKELLAVLLSIATGVSRKILRRTDDEVIDEAVALGFEKLASWDAERGSFATWYYSVVANLCRDFLDMYAMRYPKGLDQLTDKEFAALACNPVGDATVDLHAALEELTTEDQTVVQGTMEGKTQEEIGEALGRNTGWVKWKWGKLKEALKLRLGG